MLTDVHERVAAALWGHDAQLYETDTHIRELFTKAPRFDREPYLRRAVIALRAASPECYMRDGEPEETHDLNEGVVCARCYAALADHSDRLSKSLLAYEETDEFFGPTPI